MLPVTPAMSDAGGDISERDRAGDRADREPGADTPGGGEGALGEDEWLDPDTCPLAVKNGPPRTRVAATICADSELYRDDPGSDSRSAAAERMFGSLFLSIMVEVASHVKSARAGGGGETCEVRL